MNKNGVPDDPPPDTTSHQPWKPHVWTPPSSLLDCGDIEANLGPISDYFQPASRLPLISDSDSGSDSEEDRLSMRTPFTLAVPPVALLDVLLHCGARHQHLLSLMASLLLRPLVQSRSRI
jgi:hypothetical protein